MTREEAAAALNDALTAIRGAADLLRPHSGLFECYAQEKERLKSIGLFFDPTLFLSRERREADAIVGPTFDAARCSSARSRHRRAAPSRRRWNGRTAAMSDDVVRLGAGRSRLR